MMNKVVKWGLFGFVLVVLLGAGLMFFSSGVRQAVLGDSNSFVYCNDPSSLCCVMTSTSVPSESLGLNDFYLCPSYAVKCVITNTAGYDSVGGTVYFGSKNCQTKSVLGVKYFACDDKSSKTVMKGVNNVDVPKNTYVWADRKMNVDFVVYGQKLVTDMGVAVLSDSCAFSVSDVLSKTGASSLTDEDGKDIITSYTVPVGEALGTMDSCILTWNKDDRHICGDVTESCRSDDDCTGGNKCTNHYLQTYGCDQTDVVPSGVSLVDGFYVQSNHVNGVYNDVSVSSSRCVIQTAKYVECCGDAECGSSLVCDLTSHTCVKPESVECTKDSNCGVSVVCDFTTLTLKTPDCKNNKCGYATESVGCCSDDNCASTDYCASDYTCKKRVNNLTVCPFDCCVDDVGYVDKNCASGFCVNHACSSKPECTTDGDCGDGYSCENNECVEISNVSCSDGFFGLVHEEVGVKEECDFLCQIGLKGVEEVNVCVRDYTPLILVLATVLVIGGMIVFANVRGKKNAGGKVVQKSNWLRGEGAVWRKPAFWISLGVIAGVAILLKYFKFFFWAFVVLLILFLIWSIFSPKSRKGVKIIKRKIWG